MTDFISLYSVKLNQISRFDVTRPYVKYINFISHSCQYYIIGHSITEALEKALK